MNEIKTNKEQLRLALKMWYIEYGECPENFDPKDDEDCEGAVETLIGYIEEVQETYIQFKSRYS